MNLAPKFASRIADPIVLADTFRKLLRWIECREAVRYLEQHDKRITLGAVPDEEGWSYGFGPSGFEKWSGADSAPLSADQFAELVLATNPTKPHQFVVEALQSGIAELIRLQEEERHTIYWKPWLVRGLWSLVAILVYLIFAKLF